MNEASFEVLYVDFPSRPNVPVNVLVGLEYLKAGNGSERMNIAIRRLTIPASVASASTWYWLRFREARPPTKSPVPQTTAEIRATIPPNKLVLSTWNLSFSGIRKNNKSFHGFDPALMFNLYIIHCGIIDTNYPGECTTRVG